jgi:hypothetical protein
MAERRFVLGSLAQLRATQVHSACGQEANTTGFSRRTTAILPHDPYRGPVATSSQSPDVASAWLEVSDRQSATGQVDPHDGADLPGQVETRWAEPNAVNGQETTKGRPSPDREPPVQDSVVRRGPKGFLTSRGTFALILVATSAACVTGFVVSSAAVIPAMAGWSLAVASLLAATVIRERDRLMAIWMPPLVMALVVAVLGQITLLGASPTIAREVSMFFAAMASSAPAQVVAVGGAFLILRWRFPKKRGDPQAG